MNAETVAPRPALFGTAPMVRAAIIDSIAKLDPRVQLRNPVMFVVYVGSLLTTLIGFLALSSKGGAANYGQPAFAFAISAWLWLTVLFANFAEAIAEGRGKAQAAALRSSRREVQARQLRTADRGAEQRLVPAASLRRDDLFLVEANDTIPADGEVVVGVASVDESAITGESAPVLREAGGDFCSVYRRTRVLSDWLSCGSPTTPAIPSSIG